MTKKVLVSYSQLRHLCSPDNCRPPNDDYLAAIMGARAREWFKNQPAAAPQWVSVEEGYPDYEKEVFVRTDNGCVFKANLRYGENDVWWDTAEDALVLNIVTHWMPMPELPESKE